ncbi:MAG: hypothetical protein ACOYNY_27350 [Caldilineaceae bacterium]
MSSQSAVDLLDSASTGIWLTSSATICCAILVDSTSNTLPTQEAHDHV